MPTSAGSCKLFTDLPLDEIARLESLPGAEINEAKIVLATEATAMLHGRREAAAECGASSEDRARIDLRTKGGDRGAGICRRSSASESEALQRCSSQALTGAVGFCASKASQAQDRAKARCELERSAMVGERSRRSDR